MLRVVIVACSVHQSSFLAKQLEQAWPVKAIAWSLDEAGKRPQLPLIDTYCHHTEMRNRWPHRLDSMWFVPPWLNRSLKERVNAAGTRRPVLTSGSSSRTPQRRRRWPPASRRCSHRISK